LATALGICGTAAVTACGNSASQQTGPPSSTVGTVVRGSAANQSISATEQLLFSPASITAHVNDVVEWTNTGLVTHTVTFSALPYLSDATLQPGARLKPGWSLVQASRRSAGPSGCSLLITRRRSITFAALSEHALGGAVLLISYSLGLGLHFILVALLWGIVIAHGAGYAGTRSRGSSENPTMTLL
jgi:plastocyanin